MSAEKFDTWNYLWTKRRGFLLFHTVVAAVLIAVIVLHFLFGTASTSHYCHIAMVLLGFQATAFLLDSYWSVRDQRERERRRREHANRPADAEDDWW